MIAFGTLVVPGLADLFHQRITYPVQFPKVCLYPNAGLLDINI